jgi:hypothetical protein
MLGILLPASELLHSVSNSELRVLLEAPLEITVRTPMAPCDQDTGLGHIPKMPSVPVQVQSMAKGIITPGTLEEEGAIILNLKDMLRLHILNSSTAGMDMVIPLWHRCLLSLRHRGTPMPKAIPFPRQGVLRTKLSYRPLESQPSRLGVYRIERLKPLIRDIISMNHRTSITQARRLIIETESTGLTPDQW